MTLKKKIAAVAAAAMMAMSMTAISASAAKTDIYDCTLDNSEVTDALNGKLAYGILAVGKHGRVENSYIYNNIFAETYYGGKASRIRVTVDVDRYPEGYLLDTLEDIQLDTTSVPSRATVGTDLDYGTVSLFASHYIRDNSGGVWGDYTGIANAR